MNQAVEVQNTSRKFDLNWPFGYGEPRSRAEFRHLVDDFQVDEDLGFEPDGRGEHLLLRVCKRGQNTRWLAAMMAQYYGIPESAIGYCGLKDRRSVSRQWFSVHLPGAELPAPDIDGMEILGSARHGRKLRPGMHLGNDFRIVLRFKDGGAEDVNSRLRLIAAAGVPNYFGEQRFGRDGNNLQEVMGILSRRHPRFKGKRGGLYLSSARSWLFNQVLAERVRDGSWQEVEDGPMWGRGRPVASDPVNQQEAEWLTPWEAWRQALEHSGLKQERRALRVIPQKLQWQWQECNLVLEFYLPPGCYATSVVRELAILVSPKPEQSQNLVV
jgi:tRNA pseudouridine13 synthase